MEFQRVSPSTIIKTVATNRNAKKAKAARAKENEKVFTRILQIINEC